MVISTPPCWFFKASSCVTNPLTVVRIYKCFIWFLFIFCSCLWLKSIFLFPVLNKNKFFKINFWFFKLKVIIRFFFSSLTFVKTLYFSKILQTWLICFVFLNFQIFFLKNKFNFNKDKNLFNWVIWIKLLLISFYPLN